MKKYILTALATLSIAALSAANTTITNPEKAMRKTVPIYGSFAKMKRADNTISVTCKATTKLCMVIVMRFDDDASTASYVNVLNTDGSVVDQFYAASYRSMPGSGPEETNTIFLLP